MALKAVPIWVCANHFSSQLGVTDFGFNRSELKNLRFDLGKFRKWVWCGVLAQRAIKPVEDEKPVAPGIGTSTAGNEQTTQITEFVGFHKDLNSLPMS